MDQYRTPVVWSPTTRAHDPQSEVWVGVATPGTEVAARVDAILDALTEAGHPLVMASPQSDDVLAAVHDASLLEFLAGAEERVASGPVRGARRPDARGAVPLPDAGHDRRHPDPSCRRRTRGGRQLRLRHDDGGRSGHLGGRSRGRRLRGHGRRPGAGGGARGLCRCAVRPATTRRRPASAAPATSTTPRPRPRRCAAAGTSGWPSSTSTRTRATAPPRSSTTARTSSTAPSTSTRRPAGSRTSSGTPTRPAPATARAAPATGR